jgi:hypothetical protein
MNNRARAGIPVLEERSVAMTRSAQEQSAPSPAEEEAKTEDSLFERWLARTSTSHPRIRAARAAPTPQDTTVAPKPEPAVSPIGDDLADAWFK